MNAVPSSSTARLDIGNTAPIPAAAGVLYPFNGTVLSPIFAARAMAFSSVFVLGNAMRLRRLRF